MPVIDGRYEILDDFGRQQVRYCSIVVQPDRRLQRYRHLSSEQITGKWQFVFSAFQSLRRPMSENALNGALRRLAA